jgi:hypothetical protein
MTFEEGGGGMRINKSPKGDVSDFIQMFEQKEFLKCLVYCNSVKKDIRIPSYAGICRNISILTECRSGRTGLT